MKLRKRYKRLKQVVNFFYETTDSYADTYEGEYPLGIDLAYLFMAIIKDGIFDLEEKTPLYNFLNFNMYSTKAKKVKKTIKIIKKYCRNAQK
jgi:hypothetical protein